MRRCINSRFNSFTFTSPASLVVESDEARRPLRNILCSLVVSKTDNGKRAVLHNLAPDPDFHRVLGGFLRSWILHYYLTLHSLRISFIGSHGLFAISNTIPKVLRDVHGGRQRIQLKLILS